MKRKEAYLGFLGLLGFKSLLYFETGNLSDLSYFTLFCFFSWFFIGTINESKKDRRYIQNKKTDLFFIVPLGITSLLIVLSSTGIIKDMELIMALIFLLSPILLNTYAIKLYIIRKKEICVNSFVN